MSTKQRVNGPKWRGQKVKAQSAEGLAEVARATNRLWRKHHLSCDQTGPLVELPSEPSASERVEPVQLGITRQKARPAFRHRVLMRDSIAIAWRDCTS